jgi:hypothetical protein
MKIQYIAVLLAAVAIAGCRTATVDVTKTAKGFYNQTDPNEIEIRKTRPDRHFVELGTVTVSGFTPDETAKMHNAIRAKCAPLGAQAVILTEEGVLPIGFKGMKWATGVAIRYE